MGYIITGIVTLGIFISAVQIYIFFDRCWGVPVMQMPGECALIIYTSK